VDSRQHLKALQAQVAAARAAFDAGERDKALQHLDQALSIDPSFLAAQSLRERVLASAATSAAPSPPQPSSARRFASREAYERVELRAKQRRVDHCIAATRAALGRQQPEAAAAALAELIALEPEETNVASLSAELADLRRRSARRPFGVRLAAAASFLIVAGTASWLEQPRRARPVPTATRSGRATVPVEGALLESRGTAWIAALAPELTPVELRGVPDTPGGTPATPSAIPASVPVRSPAPAIAATAPLSLPTPLSQLPPAGAPAPTPASAPIVPSPSDGGATAPSASPGPSITVGPAVTATTPIRTPSDQELVEEALQRYRRAYGRLNVQSAEAVYPTVNRVALARAFDSLESQSLTFDSCDVELLGTMARAVCHGTTHYVPKVGSRYPRTEPLVWSFELRKSDGDWTIFYAKASR
jgi:tetratricopeptide (TPR) repeat protein